MTAAMVEWASSALPAHRLLADLAGAFLRREKRVRRIDLTNVQAQTDRKLVLRQCLERHVGPEGGKWLLDDVPFELYKFFGPLAVRGSTPDEHSRTDAILLSDGDLTKCATPFETHSILFGTLDERSGTPNERKKPLLCRLFFLPEAEQAVAKAISESEDPLIEFKP
jgi:hypothetical protein